LRFITLKWDLRTRSVKPLPGAKPDATESD
jgi:hypothetical protein